MLTKVNDTTDARQSHNTFVVFIAALLQYFVRESPHKLAYEYVYALQSATLRRTAVFVCDAVHNRQRWLQLPDLRSAGGADVLHAPGQHYMPRRYH